MSTYMQMQFNLNLITVVLIKFKLIFIFDKETILESIKKNHIHICLFVFILFLLNLIKLEVY